MTERRLFSFSNNIDRKVTLKSEIKIKISVKTSIYFQMGQNPSCLLLTKTENKGLKVKSPSKKVEIVLHSMQ